MFSKYLVFSGSCCGKAKAEYNICLIYCVALEIINAKKGICKEISTLREKNGNSESWHFSKNQI